jgi:Holliday junction resolvasome RuvABC ATP-dependent DNA helicase subunit
MIGMPRARLQSSESREEEDMASKKIMYYLFIGAPGVGKGTFAKILCRELGMEHLAIGFVDFSSSLAH